MCNKPSLLAKTLDNNTIPGPNAKAVHFEVSTDGNQLRQVNVPSFVLRRVMNEGNRAQTALSMKMSTTIKIMVSMMVFGAVNDNGGVRDCTKGGKDNKMVAKTNYPEWLLIISLCVENYSKFFLFILILSVSCADAENTQFVALRPRRYNTHKRSHNSTSTAFIKKKTCLVPPYKVIFKKSSSRF